MMSIGRVLLLMVVTLVLGGDVPSDFILQGLEDHNVMFVPIPAAEEDEDELPSVQDAPEGAASLAFVFDTTGSMYDDLVQVTEGAAKILETVLERREKLLHNYVLVPFHDPVVGPVTVTTDHLVFQQHLKELDVQGGGDCPESSVKAVKMALEVSLPYSFIYVFTDASAADFVLGTDVLKLIQRKQSQVVFVMTGDCGNSSHPGYQIYEQIASTSSGQVFHLNKTDVDEVLNFVRVSLQARKVNLLAIDHVGTEEITVPLVVDHNLKEFTVSLSGDNPSVRLVDPQGQPLKDIKGLLDIDNVRVVNVKDPLPGTWTVKLKSDSSFTVRATGLSPVDFIHGFSRQPTPNLLETSYRPLKGTPTFLLVNGTNLTEPAQFESVELVGLTGDTVQQFTLSKVPDQPSLFNATPFVPPDEYFYLKVHGFDETGQPIERISTTAISAELPSIPEVSVKVKVDGVYGKDATLTCHVHSLVPFGVQWHRLMGDLETEVSPPFEYPQTNEVILRFKALTAEDEGVYLCKANNVAGSSTGQTFLEVKEPAPTIDELENPVAVPGSDLQVTCVARSTGQFNVTWSRFDSTSQRRRFSMALLRSDNRFKDWRNGTLSVRNVQKKDEGQYRCTAKNEGGHANRKIFITVQESPNITIDPVEANFVEDGNLTIHCKASGFPQPTIGWYFEGIPLHNTSSTHLINETMHLYEMQRDQEGVYYCLADNQAGSSNASIFIKYIEAPRIVHVTSKLLVKIGEKAELKCVSEGIPKPSIKWFRGNTEVLSDSFLSLSEEGSLTILGTQEVDAGDYTCVAINLAGTAQAVLTLDVGSPPTIIQPPTDTNVDIESDETLMCVAQGMPEPTVSWRMKDGRALNEHRISQDRQGSLTITGIQKEDEGVFICTAENKFGMLEIEALVKVTGIEPPKLLPRPSVVETKKGIGITLGCTVLSGRPWPSTFWYRDGRQIVDEDGVWEDEDGSLVFDATQEHDEGSYICVAVNVGGNDTQLTTLMVHVAPEISSGSAAEAVTALEGSRVVLPCPTSGDPKPKVYWTKDGLQLLDSLILPDDSLELKSITEKETGIYRCEASNVAGNTTKTFMLGVNVVPKISKDVTHVRVRQGDVALLPCKNHAVPSAQVTWSRGNNEVVGAGTPRFTLLSNGGLKFHALEEDTGTFQCMATNAVGSDKHVLDVVVLVPPTVTPLTDEVVTLISKQEAFMLCVAKGVPKPRVNWFQGEQRLEESGNVVIDEFGGLRISEVHPGHSGTYRCVAENDVGHAEHKFLLTVHDPARILNTTPSDVTALEGDEVTLPCEVSGDPTPKITWTKDGVAVNSHLATATRFDAGMYTCTASNIAGSDSFSVQLHIHAAPTILKDMLHPDLDVVAGKGLVIECPVDAVPPPEITWLKDGIILEELSSKMKITEDGRRLEVSQVDITDAGYYTCSAENAAGETRTDFQVEVFIPPKFIKDSYDPKPTVIEEGPLTLECPVVGNPTPTVSWRRDDKPMTATLSSVATIWKVDGHQLYLDHARVFHSGTYKCVASSIVGQVHREFQVEVHVVPRIEGHETEVIEALLGDQVELMCPVTGIPRPVISWMVHGRYVTSADSEFEIDTDGRILRILRTDINSGGLYQCVAASVAGEASKIIELKVLVPPSIKDGNLVEIVKVVVSEDLILSCQATGIPTPSILWSRNGVTMHEGHDGLLILKDVKPMSSGSFKCLAKSKAGIAEKDYEVQVIVPPAVTSTRDPPRLEVLLGVPLTLECPVNGYPLPTITWYKDGQSLGTIGDVNLVFSGDRRELKLVNAREVDIGQYKCVAVNEAGETSVLHFVDVHTPPEMESPHHVGISVTEVKEGEAVKLECPVKGNPAPKITWLRDGRPQDAGVEFGGQLLVFSDVSQSDAGRYTCIATNIAGSAQREFDLDVHVPPRAENNVSVSERTTLATLSRPVTLECIINGHPQPQVLWLKENQTLQTVDDSNVVVSMDGRKLKLLRARVSDTGTFTCVASNDAGETRLHFPVDVQVPPRIDRTNSSSKLRAIAGDSITLYCIASGNPTPVAMWLKDGHRLQNDSSVDQSEEGELRIQIVREDDAGKFTCVSSNSAGVDEVDIILEISVPPKFENNEDPHEDIIVLENRPITLMCPVIGTPPLVVAWLKDGEPISRLADPNLSVLPSEPRRLRIRRAKSKDSGRFSCIATNDAGQIRKDFDVSISVPPRIENTNSKIYDENPRVAEGSLVKFVCEATGYPTPSIIWLKNGRLLSPEPDITLDFVSDAHFTEENHVMIFDRVYQSHAGRYTCVATNSAGNDERDFNLEIMIPPKSSSDKDSDSQRKVVRLNRPVVIKCPLEANPYPTYTWLKNGKPVTVLSDRWVRTMDRGRQVHVVRAREEDDAIWTCVAENDAGKAQVDIEVQVQVAPTARTPQSDHVARVGDILHLECQVSGKPRPTIDWIKDGDILEHENEVLTITKVTPSSNGKFTCIATNEVGTAEQLFTVEVIAPPEIDIAEGTTEAVVLVNRPVTLECPVTSSGPTEPLIFWTRDGIEMVNDRYVTVSSNGQRLQLLRTRQDDGGYYECVASNEAGESKRTFRVDVWVPPKIEGDLSDDNGLPNRILERYNTDFECYASGNPQPNVTWFKDDIMISEGLDVRVHLLDDNQHLRITNVLKSDEGRYTCVASSPAGSAERDYQLLVDVAAQVKEFKENPRTVIVNRPVTFECDYSGDPIPTATWYINEVAADPFLDPNLQLLDGGRVLQLRRARQIDTGKYTCMAANSAGKDEKSLQVEVLSPPAIDRSHWVSSPMTTIEGQPTELECLVSGHPLPSVIWEKDGDTLVSGNQRHLKITADGQKLRWDRTSKANSGMYTCLAINAVGTDEASVKLNVIEPPRIVADRMPSVVRVLRGEPVVLNCPSQGEPSPTVTWSKDERPLDAEGPELRLSRVHESNAGRYTCLVTNLAGTAEAFTDLEVHVSPSIRGQSSTSPLRVLDRHGLTLECQVSGTPVPLITWLKDSHPLDEDEKRRHSVEYDVLRLRNVSAADAGHYTCLAVNEAGAQERSYHVIVLVPPQIQRSQVDVETAAIAGDDVTFICPSIGIPKPKIVWRKDAKLIVPNGRFHFSEDHSRLIVTGVQLVDEGVFECAAVNEAGEDNMGILLSVLVPPFFNDAGNTDAQEHQKVLIDQPIVLECNVKGSPQPVVTWFKDNEPVDGTQMRLSADGQRLEIRFATVENDGTYFCIAENDAGIIEKEILLDVQVPPVIDASKVRHTVHSKVDEKLTLECPVKGDPHPSVIWLRDGFPIETSDRIQILEDGFLLSISHTSLSDEGEVTCVATSDAGTIDHTFDILIHAPPRMLEAGARLEEIVVIANRPFKLECPSGGNPPPQISWTKDGHPINSSSGAVTERSTLQISRAVMSDGGQYECQATNDAGIARRQFNVEVLVATRIIDSRNEILSVIANSSVDLNCTAEGVPRPIVNWFMNSKPIEEDQPGILVSNNGFHLQMLRVTKNDIGVYSCVASNMVGNSTKDFSLGVIEPPLINDNVHLVTAKVNDPVTLPCQTIGVPKPRTLWFKGEEKFAIGTGAPGGEFLIPEAKVSDAGVYSCVAVNEAGEDTKTVVLEVQVPPSFKESHSDIVVQEGDSVFLPCIANGIPVPTVTWRHGITVIVDGENGFVITEDGSLHINNVRIHDAGLYGCWAQNPAGSAFSERRLTVHVPPSIAKTALELRVLQGHDAVFICEVSGAPPPQVTWLRNEISLPSPLPARHQVLREGLLQIATVQPDDAGVFRCVAKNSAGIASKDITLVVLVPPRISPALPSEWTVIRGGSVYLPCHAEGFPPPLISWTKSDDALIWRRRRRAAPSPGDELVIEGVQREDSGYYICVAVNEAGRVAHQVTLVIHVPPSFTVHPENQVVSIGTDVRLNCEAQGHPIPKIVWLRDGVHVFGQPWSSDGKGWLNLEKISREDAGVYACLAVNDAGEKVINVTVTVQVPPVVLAEPGNIWVAESDMLTLACIVDGDPFPKVTWTRHGQRIIESDRVQYSNTDLIIGPIQEDDEGPYKCILSNSAGTAEGMAMVTVHTPPRIVLQPMNTVVDLGEVALLDCVAKGKPTPKVDWFKGALSVLELDDRIHILPNGSLRIVAVQVDDEGYFGCAVSNEMATIEAEAFVSVRVHGKWSTWSPWSECGVSCGQGLQSRNRKCDNPEPRKGGSSCSGAESETRPCERDPCPVDGSWSPWLEWSGCSASCGPGTRVRMRKCDNPKPEAGGRDCNGDSVALEACVVIKCPVHGDWGAWGPWSECSATCGEGISTRRRLCDSPKPAFGGDECPGLDSENKPCQVVKCQVDGEWGTWGAWSTCSLSCGGGVRHRQRHCDSPAPSGGGKQCTGSDLQMDYCSNDPCPIHGQWSSWSSWGECSVSCDGGHRRRFRTCDNPIPSNGGRSCAGASQDAEDCNMHKCAQDGQWAPWSEWSLCSSTCGTGTRQRHRSCSDPPPRFGGKRCAGDDSQVEECSLEPCEDVPVSSIGNLIGSINGEDIGLSAVVANVTTLGNERTVMATITNVPINAANQLSSLVSLLSPIYWTTAFEVGQAINGFSLTKGYFRRESQVAFATGEIIRMTHVARGVDRSGNLLVDVVVSGEVPNISLDDDVTIDKYTEDYVQTGPGSLHAFSTRTFRVADYTLPYAWNHTILYDDTQGNMPFLVQKLHVTNIGVHYEPTKEELRFVVSASIGKGSPSNRCPTGLTLDVEGQYCQDDDECFRLEPCSHGCVNTVGSFYCSCPVGYTLGPDGHNCQDVDECRLGLNECTFEAECENTLGSYRCLANCKTGYRRSPSGTSCVDVDECTEQEHICDQQCLNVIGDYKCDCSRGYRLVGRSRCVDIDECQQLDRMCSHGCDNTPGSYRCTCPDGFILEDDSTCQDVDECAVAGKHTCGRGRQCQNTMGSFKCIDLCPPGFRSHLNGSCVDVDECRQGPTVCHFGQLCENTHGGYRCTCPIGFKSAGSGLPCTDVNECLEEPNPCAFRCLNLLGDYECQCPPGQKRLADRKSCAGLVYVNEEVTRSSLRPCPLGFQRISGSCQDYDECQTEGRCQYRCENLVGSYKCLCPTGYRLASNERSCVDIDECYEDNIKCGADKMCFNLRGSYECVDTPCPKNFERDAVTGYCKLSCDRTDAPCPPGVRFAQLLAFRTVALPSGIKAFEDLVRLAAFDQNGHRLPNTVFQIIENEAGAPFRIRPEQGKGVVYTVKALDSGKRYKMTVQAISFDLTRTIVQYTTKFVVYIAVAEHPY